MRPGMDSAAAHQICLEAQLALEGALCTCASHSPAALSLLDADKTCPSNESPTTIRSLYGVRTHGCSSGARRLEYAWLAPDKPGCSCLGMTREPSLVTGESCAQAHCGSVEPGAVRLCLRTRGLGAHASGPRAAGRTGRRGLAHAMGKENGARGLGRTVVWGRGRCGGSGQRGGCVNGLGEVWQ